MEPSGRCGNIHRIGLLQGRDSLPAIPGILGMRRHRPVCTDDLGIVFHLEDRAHASFRPVSLATTGTGLLLPCGAGEHGWTRASRDRGTSTDLHPRAGPGDGCAELASSATAVLLQYQFERMDTGRDC